MGPAFGATAKLEPEFDLLRGEHDNVFEVRLYKPCFGAEIPLNDNTAFKAAESLTRYLVDGGFPQYSQGKKMIGPTSQIVAKSPGLAEDCVLQYVFPGHFSSIEEIPKPQNKDIVIRKIPKRAVAVLKFSGKNNRARLSRKLLKLRDMLLHEGLLGEQRQDLGPDDPERTLDWSVAEYHPYVMLPFLWRNEIGVELPMERNPGLERLLESRSCAGDRVGDQEDGEPTMRASRR